MNTVYPGVLYWKKHAMRKSHPVYIAKMDEELLEKRITSKWKLLYECQHYRLITSDVKSNRESFSSPLRYFLHRGLSLAGIKGRPDSPPREGITVSTGGVNTCKRIWGCRLCRCPPPRRSAGSAWTTPPRPWRWRSAPRSGRGCPVAYSLSCKKKGVRCTSQISDR